VSAPGPRRPSFRASLRGQLLFVVLAALGPALVFVLWGANREQARALRAAEAADDHYLSVVARALEASLDATRGLLEGTASLLEERDGRPDPARCGPGLERLRRVEPRYASVLVALADGRVVCSSPGGAGEVSLADRPYFKAALETDAPAMGEFQIGRLSGKPAVALAQPVRGPSGATVAVAVASIDLAWLSEALGKIPAPAGSRVLVLDRAGTVLASQPAEGSAAGSPFPFASRLGEIADAKHAVRGAADAASSAHYWQAARLVRAGATLGFVALGVPEETLFGEAGRALTRQLLALGLVAAVALAAVWFFAQALLVSRIERLAGAAHRLGEGDLSARSALPAGGGELATLSRAFDGMADSLERRAEERLRAEAELRRSEDALRALTERLDGIREEEGTRIARELHDEVGQALTGLKLDLAALRRSLPEADAATLERIAGMSALADATIERVRRISGELRPLLLDQLGLLPAVEAYLERFGERTGVRTRLEAALDEEALDRRRASALFRILQEALTNVARHAAAAGVTVRLAAEGDDVVLTVSDDGRGFAAPAGPGLGLLGMRERARAAGGRVTVEGAPGRGTVVTARLPRAAGPAPPGAPA
jgi:signal transduction histidine kinase